MEKSLLKARLAALNPSTSLPPAPHSEAEESEEVERLKEDGDEEEEETDSFPSTLSSMAPPVISKRRRGKDYSPISASPYFSSALELPIASTTFRLYHSPAPPGKPTFICLHGAGHSALGFALLAGELRDRGVGVLAHDCRNHGKTVTDDGAEGRELDLETMTEDLREIVKEIFQGGDRKSVVLVGHSMGGAVAVNGCPLIADLVNVVGLVVLDVVEGTALEALSSMTSIISSLPKGFDSLETGIEWHMRSKTLSNSLSARISVPPLLVASADESSPLKYVWRTDLLATKPFWEGWFTGLSSKFLACKTAKLLVLAGADRLDKELMIGQMQGKFQREVFPDVGHSLHEDAPERTADLLIAFWKRNDRTDILKGVKKVGEV